MNQIEIQNEADRIQNEPDRNPKWSR